MGTLSDKGVQVLIDKLDEYGHLPGSFADDAQDALRELLEARKRIRLLHDATTVLRRGMGGHQHWDAAMTHGANCPTCIQQREAKDCADELIAACDFQSCPACGSPSPGLHPAVQHGGEVQVCENEFHNRTSFWITLR